MKTLYSKDELLKHLTDELDEELEGIKDYEDVYHSFVALGLRNEASDIERIANDEYKHACILWDILKEHNVDLTKHEKIQKDWECVKAIFHI
jgi:ferritin